ncbi:MAG: hypothetical protein ABI839_01900 [Verrucomicrobiota bacterium]
MDDVIDESPAPRPDRTFFLAVALITAVGAIELLAAFFHIVGKARAERAATAAVATTPAPAPAAPANVARVAPAPVTSVPTVPAPGAPLSASERLLQEARAFNQRGDTANALAKLQEAAQRDPRNAPVLAEMATIYESIQLWDRSNETWRKIQEIGPPAGDLYRLAEMKLKVGASATLPATAAKAAPNTQTAAASAPVAARAATVDGTGTALDREGIPEGSVFGVTEISSENVPDPDAETNLRIKIAVKKRDRVPIELARLKIVVRFYDLIDNERVADTDADVNFEWLNPKHDWSETNPETLVVSYVRARNHAVNSEAAISAAAAAVTPGKPTRSGKKRASQPVAEPTPEGAGRKYLGYVVRIYYDDKLQTVRADPTRLLKDAPGATLP